MSELEVSIRDLISLYLAGTIDASELNDRLPDAWDLDEAEDPDATDLVLRAVGYLAGFQAGDRSEDELRDLLTGLVTTVRAEYPADQLWWVLLRSKAVTVEVPSGGRIEPLEGFSQEAGQHPQTERQTTTALLDPPRIR